MGEPKVTIILPCFNSEKYIRNAVNSCRKQSYENLELIAVDNESTDGTFGILQELNLNPLSAKNIHPHSWEEPVLVGMEHMTGDYFTILASDDVIESEYIEKNVYAIEAFKDKESILGIQSHILPTNIMGQTGYCIGYPYNNLEEFKKLYLDRCPVNTPSVFYKRSAIQYYVPSAKHYQGAHDYFVYGHMAHYGKMIFPMPYYFGYIYNIHENQATWGMKKEPRNFDKEIQDYWRKQWTNDKSGSED